MRLTDPTSKKENGITIDIYCVCNDGMTIQSKYTYILMSKVCEFLHEHANCLNEINKEKRENKWAPTK